MELYGTLGNFKEQKWTELYITYIPSTKQYIKYIDTIDVLHQLFAINESINSQLIHLGRNLEASTYLINAQVLFYDITAKNIERKSSKVVVIVALQVSTLLQIFA